jgi:hypothetical protein
MRDSIRLTFKMHRFELVALSVVAAFLFVAAFWVAGQLDAVGYGPCAMDRGPVPANCESLGQEWYGIQESQASPIFGFMAILPFVTGVFLGGPLIAREIERGTTRLAWSLAPSRLRWYLSRMLPIVVAVVGVTFVAGVAADRLTAAISPNVDMANAFDGFGQRGVLVAMTALVMAAGAIGLGAVTGRVLPTVILALILGTLGVTGVTKLHGDFTAREAILVDGENVGRGDRYVDQFFRLPDGRLVDWNGLAEFDPASMTGETEPDYPIVSLVVPGSRYREIETRQALLLGAIALVMLAGTAAIVQRRRPG